ncbi:tRNA-uridine aminocarboxypropyltransferase 1 [Nematolebias whitei]|uniref:tRNA-uridine aminocarboxypropyltransferase 1 n=1 Tax=Nematolebias whitei TaxID=451745 RepID=UPI00189827DC|nr:tRNA-uridine aminocarboxypropyltransferase 1 [Nematolebias whitei]
MSSLDPHQQLSPGCRDNTTGTGDSSDVCEHSKRPLQGLKLASHAVLEKAQQSGRVKCSKCGGSRMFFCYTCCSLMGVSDEEIPLVQLPVKIDIIKHPNETDGKSTAVHAKILAPNDVTIYTYPCIPEYDRQKVVLVFPGPQAVSVQDMLQSLRDRSTNGSHDFSEPCRKRLRTEGVEGSTQSESISKSQVTPLQKVVFIDSTWNQTNKISTDERLHGLVQVELKARKTCFWRSQKGKPDTYLATIEALYYFMKDFHQQCLGLEYDGEYDNLLFFYSFLHSVINTAKSAAGRS